MTPHEYVAINVLPTVREYLVDRFDHRRMTLACIVVYHTVDHLALAALISRGAEPNQPSLRAEVRLTCTAMRVACASAFDIVHGVCHGTKHARMTQGAFRFQPGDERSVPAFAFNLPGAGWNEGRWDMPGLEVEHNDQRFFVDWCVQTVLLAFRDLYAASLGPIDLTFLDAVFRGQPR